jgi:hypothetical protein
MYFANLAKLATSAFKKQIPLNQKILDIILEHKSRNKEQTNIRTFIESACLNITQDVGVDNAAADSMQQNINNIASIFEPILAVCLVIDEIYCGIDIESISYRPHINYLINSLKLHKNINIELNIALDDENYHALQEYIYEVSRYLILYISTGNAYQGYSEQELQQWFDLC